MQSYGLNGLDVKLLKYLNFYDGIFIEAGANDGITQTNTLILEKNFNWRGILIEPNPIKFNQCVQNRPKSIVENYALVSKNYKLDSIKGDFNQVDWGESLSGMVMDSGDWTDDWIDHNRNLKLELNSQNMIEVPVTTLTALLNKHSINKIDFFSLDVEGYEISVLGGLDFEKFRPTYMLIETTSDLGRRQVINDFLISKNYRFVEEMSFNDCLYRDINSIFSE